MDQKQPQQTDPKQYQSEWNQLTDNEKSVYDHSLDKFAQISDHQRQRLSRSSGSSGITGKASDYSSDK